MVQKEKYGLRKYVRCEKAFVHLRALEIEKGVSVHGSPSASEKFSGGGGATIL